MRLLILHADRFAYTVTEAARSPLREAVDGRAFETEECLLVLASVETADTPRPTDTARLAAAEIERLGRQLAVGQIVLHPFAHLFGELAAPAIAVQVLDHTRARLVTAGFTIHRSPFGWFTRWELQAKGHPLSRVARIIQAAPAAPEPGPPP
jgi:hypothetical protein